MSRFVVKKALFLLIMCMATFHSDAITANGDISASSDVYSAYLKFLYAVNRSAPNNQLKRYFSKAQNSYFSSLEGKGDVKGRLGREIGYELRELLVRPAKLTHIVDYKAKQYRNYVCLILIGSDDSGEALTVVIRYINENNQNKIDYVAIDTANKASVIGNTDPLCAYVAPDPFFD